MTVSNEDQAKVFAACELLVDEAVELLVDLIKIPSENPRYKCDEKMYTMYCGSHCVDLLR